MRRTRESRGARLSDGLARELLNWLALLRRESQTRRASIDIADVAHRIGDLLRLGRSAASRYRGGLFDAAPDAITLIDRDGQIVDANQAAERLFGWAHDELRRRSVYDLNPGLPPGHMSRVWEQLDVGAGPSRSKPPIRAAPAR